jgi:hypothetical protein
MKKLIKLFIIYLAFVGACFAEQKVVFISYSWKPTRGTVTDTKDLEVYLKQGWKIVQISGSGAEGTRIWAVVIEKDELIVEKKDK